MHSSLALVYRPKSWSEVCGQTVAVQVLRSMVAAGKVHPTIVLHGPKGTGKTSIGRILTLALNCSSAPDPCGSCETCRRILEGRSFALLELDAASHGLIDDVRKIGEDVRFLSAERWRVYLVDEAHSLSDKAWQAFLKLLEEPPPGVVFCFATTEFRKVPDTIRSRAFCFGLSRVHPQAVMGRLEQIAAEQQIACEAGALQAIVRHTDGSLRDAISLLEQTAWLGGVTVQNIDLLVGRVADATVWELVQALAKRDRAETVRLVRLVAEQQPDLRVLVGQLGEALGEAVQVRLGVAVRPAGPEIAVCQVLEAAGWHVLLERVTQLATYLERTSVPARALVEVGLLSICGLDVGLRPVGANPAPASVPVETRAKTSAEMPACSSGGDVVLSPKGEPSAEPSVVLSVIDTFVAACGGYRVE